MFILLILFISLFISFISVWFHGVVGLSHNFHVVRVPGSNPGGTIFLLEIMVEMWLQTKKFVVSIVLLQYFFFSPFIFCLFRLFWLFYFSSFILFYFVIFFFSLLLEFLNFFLLSKKAAEGSFDQPTCKLWACRAATAPPRFHTLCPFECTQSKLMVCPSNEMSNDIDYPKIYFSIELKSYSFFHCFFFVIHLFIHSFFN